MTLEHVPVAPIDPDRIMSLLERAQRDDFAVTIRRGRELVGARAIWNISSTARGGGVAEMLASLLAYIRGAGLDARWVVIDGSSDFYRVTKRIHNMLHGDPGDGMGLGPADEAIYRDTAKRNARELTSLVRAGDIVLLHDPQTAGLIEPIRASGAHVVWRCHVGTDVPNGPAREAWEFLRPHVLAADALVFSRPAFVWAGLDEARVSVIRPSIDAFSAKNQDMPRATVSAILRAAGVETGAPQAAPVFRRRDGSPGRVDRRADLHGSFPLPAAAPAVVQVSRWDRLKDPRGVLSGFTKSIAGRTGAHLVLAGPAVDAVRDDPEGAEVLSEIGRLRAGCEPSIAERVHLLSLPMHDVEENAALVNALQRRADVIVQKSLAEGFGLTVAEAMWKARPVVASRVGGIREQVVDGETGILVDPDDLPGFAAAVVRMVEEPGPARQMGLRARDRVRQEFLGPRQLRQYVDLMERLLAGPPAAQRSAEPTGTSARSASSPSRLA